MIIGLFGIVKIVVSGSHQSFVGGLFLPLFFVVHYGGFMAGHLLVLLALYAPNHGQAGGSPDPIALLADYSAAGLWIPVLALLISHGWSFVSNYLGSEERNELTVGEAMALPYKRMAITHIALIAGGFFVVQQGQPLIGLLSLLGMKIVMDVAFHRREHRAGRLAGAAA